MCTSGLVLELVGDDMLVLVLKLVMKQELKLVLA